MRGYTSLSQLVIYTSRHDNCNSVRRVTHKGLIGDEFIGGKAVMKLNNIHVFCSHTYIVCDQ